MQNLFDIIRFLRKKIISFISPIKRRWLFFVFVLIIFGEAGFIFFTLKELNLTVYYQLPYLKENLITLENNTLVSISTPLMPENKESLKIRIIATAYSSTPWETDGDPHITAAGTWVREGIIANNLLPFGTQIKLPEIYGDKIFVVEDRMAKKKGYYHVDIWFPSYWEAKEFGAKTTYMEILEG